MQKSALQGLYFYPRSPCGERPSTLLPRNTPRSFLSTLSLRRATIHGRFVRSWTDISIHALLAESDLPVPANLLRGYHFYPRSPCGERRAEHHANSQQEKFLSTLSLRRATLRRHLFCTTVLPFLSTLSLRRATSRHNLCPRKGKISIHALLAESD